jgi:hypothetical protein
MNTIINSRKVRFQTFLTTFLMIFGLLILLVSTIALFFLHNDTLSLPLFVLGFVVSIVGIRLGNRWIRQPTPIQALDNALKGFGKPSALYHYSLPVNHILVCQSGVLSLSTFPHEIHLTVDGSDWSTTGGFTALLRQLFFYGLLGDPQKVALRDARRMQAWFDERLPHHDIAVQPLIVFTNPGATVRITNQPAVPITYTHKGKYSLKTYIRQHLASTLHEQEIEHINTTLQAKKQKPSISAQR